MRSSGWPGCSRFAIGGGTPTYLSPDQLARVLDVNGKLCDTILLRALCTGDVAFFEAGLARLAKVQVANTRILIHDEGRKGLKAIWGKAGLPP